MSCWNNINLFMERNKNSHNPNSAQCRSNFQCVCGAVVRKFNNHRLRLGNSSCQKIQWTVELTTLRNMHFPVWHEVHAFGLSSFRLTNTSTQHESSELWGEKLFQQILLAGAHDAMFGMVRTCGKSEIVERNQLCWDDGEAQSSRDRGADWMWIHS